jgi:hypothetical protein
MKIYPTIERCPGDKEIERRIQETDTRAFKNEPPK